jgi:hypothetical protein
MTLLPSPRKALLLGAELLPWIAGGTLLWLGVPGKPGLSVAGSLVLVVLGLLQLGRIHGHLAPRPGGLRIATYGRGDTPLAFFVRHRGQPLLFYRTLDSARGRLPDSYCVVVLPRECDDRVLRWRGFEPPEDSRLVGLVPAGELRFERRGGDFVDAASLAETLERAACAPAGSR